MGMRMFRRVCLFAGARALWRCLAAALAVLFLTGTALSVVSTASPAAAAGKTLYTYAGANTTGLTTCPKTSSTSEQCTLTEALSDAAAGGTVALDTPGSSGRYIGNWTVSTAGTSFSAPLTIKPAPGVSKPTLDGNHGKATGCQTKTCDGTVLTIGSKVYFDLHGVTVLDGNNTTRHGGEAIDNVQGGTVVVLGCTFSDSTATNNGGAIDNGALYGSGTLTVSASTFSANTAGLNGGAIDNGDLHGSGTLVVTDSTFSGNTATLGDAGAIGNGDLKGHGTLTVSDSTFSGNTSTGEGGAIDSADAGKGTLTVSGSTFSGNTARNDDGGAIDNSDSGGTGTAVVSACTFSDNHGTPIATGNDGGKGTFTVSDSTFSGNTTMVDCGAICNGYQGTGTLTVSDSTFSGNHAGGSGGAIENGGTSTLVVSGSTLSDNTAEGGGDTISNLGNLWSAGDIFNGTCARFSGTWKDEGDNVGNSATCLNAGKGNVTKGANQFGPLAHNGGPTETMLPLKGNPAIGVIPFKTTATLNGKLVKLCPTTDQRGVRSASGKACNAGAVQS